MPGKRAKALLVSSDTLFRQALERLLEASHVRVVGSIDAVEEIGPDTLGGDEPDIVLLDASDDPEVLANELSRLRTAFCAAKPIVLAGRSSQHSVAIALDCGAAGYLTKNITAEALAECARLVVLGITVWSSDTIATLASHRATAAAMSQREVQVLERLVHGDANKEIALRLGISEQTVKTYVRGLMRRFNVKNRVQLAIWTRTSGILTMTDSVRSAS